MSYVTLIDFSFVLLIFCMTKTTIWSRWVLSLSESLYWFIEKETNYCNWQPIHLTICQIVSYKEIMKYFRISMIKLSHWSILMVFVSDGCMSRTEPLQQTTFENQFNTPVDDTYADGIAYVDCVQISCWWNQTKESA